MQEQELFQSYEVKNWDFNPRVYKILAVSAIFNVLALFIVGQTNLLTTKGCDSPLVGGVCRLHRRAGDAAPGRRANRRG